MNIAPVNIAPVNARPAERGFSLLEVLVALVVLGLLIGTLTQGVRFGVGAVAAQARIVGVRGDEDAVERALRRLVEHMDPGTFTTPPDMSGTAARAEFVTELPAAALLPGQGNAARPPLRIDAVLETDARHRLVLRWRPHVGGQRLVPPPPPSEEVLLSGVDRVTFGFLSAQQGWQACCLSDRGSVAAWQQAAAAAAQATGPYVLRSTPPLLGTAYSYDFLQCSASAIGGQSDAELTHLLLAWGCAGSIGEVDLDPIGCKYLTHDTMCVCSRKAIMTS